MHSLSGERKDVTFQYEAQTLLRLKGFSPVLVEKDAFHLKALYYVHYAVFIMCCKRPFQD